MVIMENETMFPDVYVMTVFSSLLSAVKEYFPENVNIINIPVAKEMGYDKKSHISEEAVQLLKNAEVIIIDNKLLVHVLWKMPNVKWVQATYAGVEFITEEVEKAKRIPPFMITRYSDKYYGETVADYVIAQIINIERNFYTFYERSKKHYWERPKSLPVCRRLSELTVGILGAGAIGSTVGRMLKRNGAKVLAFVKHTRNHPSENYNETTTDLDDITERCDYICNMLPSTMETRGLLDGEVLQNNKKSPVFINVGRSDIIKESTIIKALKLGWISKAILDIFDIEPLPADNQLWNTPEVYITPHVAGFPRVDEIAKFAAENYESYVNGKPLMNLVDWNRGY